MPHRFTPDDIREVLAVLCGRYRFEMFDSLVVIQARDLPGKAVAVISPMPDGRLLLIYDLRKPDALGHLRELLREYWASYAEPVAFPDGTVELVPRVMPRSECRSMEVAVGA